MQKTRRCPWCGAETEVRGEDEHCTNPDCEFVVQGKYIGDTNTDHNQ